MISRVRHPPSRRRIEACPRTARGRGTRQVSCPPAREAEDPMTRTARRDLAAGLTRTSTRRAALVGLLGVGLVAGSIPALAGDQQGAAGKAKKAGKAKPNAGKAKPKAGKTKPAASQVTAASEVSTSASEVTARREVQDGHADLLLRRADRHRRPRTRQAIPGLDRGLGLQAGPDQGCQRPHPQLCPRLPPRRRPAAGRAAGPAGDHLLRCGRHHGQLHP